MLFGSKRYKADVGGVVLVEGVVAVRSRVETAERLFPQPLSLFLHPYSALSNQAIGLNTAILPRAPRAVSCHSAMSTPTLVPHLVILAWVSLKADTLA